MDTVNPKLSAIISYVKLIFKRSFVAVLNERVQLVLILILGAALRLINLGNQPYWGDEALSAGVLRHYANLGDLIQYVRLIEYYPPLSYILLHFWSGIFGDSVLAMRSPSMILGTITIFVTYLFGQTMFNGRRVGLYAALIVAVLPMQINFSQYIRPYAMISLFGLLAAFAYVRYNQERSFVAIILYVISSVLGLYAHYSFIFILLPVAVFWIIETLLRDKESLVRSFITWLSVHAVIFLAFYPWLEFFLYKLIFNKYIIFSLPESMHFALRDVSFFGITVGQLLWTSKGLPVSRIEVFSILLVKLALIGFVAYLFWVKNEQIRQLFKGHASAITFLSWMIIVPMTMYLFSPVSIPYTPIPQQHIIIVSIMVALFIAVIIDQFSLKLQLLFISLFLTSLLTFTVNVIGDDSLWDVQYRLEGIASFINDNYNKGDIVVSGYNILRTDLNYYLRPELSTIGFYPTNYYGIDFMNSRDTMGLAETEFHFHLGQPTQQEFFSRMDNLVKFNKAKRIWLTFFIWPTWMENWAKERGWNKEFSSIHKLLPLELYEKKVENK
ncbi:hypothetical protein A3H10_01780 [Candidatus Uhrbacteria bacterium RIFCSPLOWO2_12_FULL_46_10]|nr:MAG: hypothetical protein A3H10_01780 [Candidatus Uhrbacteria bacterium RIFCSPLOWO2_12_FULL_46_10]